MSYSLRPYLLLNNFYSRERRRNRLYFYKGTTKIRRH